MFGSVARRLALLNAVVVVGVIALVTLVSYAAVSQTLTRQVDSDLTERAATVVDGWSNDLWKRRVGELPAAVPEPSREGDSHRLGSELLEGGDTLVYVFGADGALIYAPHNVSFPDLPYQAGVAEALTGATDIRDVPVSGTVVRVLTVPVIVEGVPVGSVQLVRGKQQVIEQLRLISWANLATVGLGALIAVPAGLFLARRAMRPISEAFARQRSFVADASHELRTPLAVIRANVELAQRLLPVDSEVRAELGAVVAEVDQMAAQVDDLLFLARADAGQIAKSRVPLDLAATAAAAAEPMRAVAERSGVALAVSQEATLPVMADADEVRRLVRILVDNAIRYTPSGGRVDVVAGLRDGRPTVRVVDTGSGIPAADQERVFQRFARADAPRSRQVGGTGLGLAIAKAIATAHGGRIGLASTPGNGTEVWFWLPAAAPDANAPQALPRTARTAKG